VPNINDIKKTMLMKALNIPQDVLAALGFDDPNYKPGHNNFDILVKMNDLLTMEQKCAVMERQGCHKTGKMDKESKDFGKEHADKSLAAKLEILEAKGGDVPFLNDDRTISLPVHCYVGDIDGVVRGCHCLKGNYKAEFNSFVEEHPDKVLSF
jgi:predicted DNA-binding protein with PD1-like motif